MKINMGRVSLWALTAVLIVTMLVAAGCFGVQAPNPSPGVTAVPREQFEGNCYHKAGGDLECKSGGTVTMKTGSTMTADSGATVDFSSATVSMPGMITNTTTSLTLSGALAQTQVNSAGGSANPYDYTGTLGNMNGSDDFTLFDVNITNGTHSGSNTIQVLDIAGITGSASATETAINVGTGWDAGLDLNGTPLVLGADGGVYLDETADDRAALTFGAGTGVISVTVGNLAIGNGEPGTALDGEDLYVEGASEFDGAAKFDGSVTANGNLDINGTNLYIGADQGIYVDETSDGVATMAMGAGTDKFSFLTGNLLVGNGTPSSTQDGEDLYVEGKVEVDGALIHGSTTVTPSLDALAITPAYDLYIIGSSGAVSVTLQACSVNGQIVTLAGEDNNNVTINDSNVRTHDGSAEVIGQYDVVSFICVGTEWWQMGLAGANQ